MCEQKRLFSLSLWIPRKRGFSTRNNHFKLIREEEATTTTRERNELLRTHFQFKFQNDEFDQIPRVRSLDRECLLTE